MRENVYDYLYDYGFSSKEIDNILDNNEEMFFTNLTDVKKHINFLENKYLEPKDIIDVINSNPYMLTDREVRFNYLNNIYYNELEIDNESLKQLIMSNPRAYSVNPNNLNKNIEYLKEHNYTIKTIKNFFIDNPQIVSMSPEEFKDAVKFN